jgi:hypothetical protein
MVRENDHLLATSRSPVAQDELQPAAARRLSRTSRHATGTSCGAC